MSLPIKMWGSYVRSEYLLIPKPKFLLDYWLYTNGLVIVIFLKSNLA